MAGTANKPLIWLRGEVKTPPFSAAAQIEAGFLLRGLQKGESLSLPPFAANANDWLTVP